LTPIRHLQALPDLSRRERRDLAALLKSVLSAFDRVFNVPFPYVMAIHQRPTDGLDHHAYHLHVEFYTPMRSAGRLKYLAGSELGAGVFINDTLPEESAARLRACVLEAERSEELVHG
jgi:UDPglucose--hexose-1-phosphate uridylyltransferase